MQKSIKKKVFNKKKLEVAPLKNVSLKEFLTTINQKY